MSFPPKLSPHLESEATCQAHSLVPHNVQSSSVGSDHYSSRPDGKGYIDEEPGTGTETGETELSDSVASGSSVEEDGLDFADRAQPDWSNQEESHASDTRRDDGLSCTHKLDQAGEEDWEVQDEDWELAQGGEELVHAKSKLTQSCVDFTKQYNRLRQQYAAVHMGSQPRQGSSVSESSRPLLPARNYREPPRSRGSPGPSRIADKRLIDPAVFTGGVATNPKSSIDRQEKDKSDRATQEQVLDNRTRLVLSSLTNRGAMGQIERCISTGKEANVYYALSPSIPLAQPSPFPPSLAVKIYRTSILNFRSRQNYIVGEHRFRGEYSSAKNPRKMVRVWADKELRNLKRLEQGGVRAPRVVEGKENVLVMEFLGDAEHASPRLKDADIPDHMLADLYAELLVTMRRLYHHCKLVHADLSEYNILYHDSHLYIIDVSQSVEHDHPRTFDFLRTDIRNMNGFFGRRSGSGDVRTLGMRRTWDYIVSDSVGGLRREDEKGQEGERRLMAVVCDWIDADNQTDEENPMTPPTGVHGDEATQESLLSAASDEAVFMSSFIPRSLAEVFDPERDVDILKAGQGDQLIYAGLSGLDPPEDPHYRQKYEETVTSQGGGDLSQQPQRNVHFDVEGTDDDSVGRADGEADSGRVDSRPRGFRHEDKDEKKARKQAVKSEKREKRNNKLPKAEKQKLVKQSSVR